MTPLIIEAALNGGTPKARNPNVPKTPGEVVRDALACLDAGAAIIHSHPDKLRLTGEEAARSYMAAWAPILDERPDTILSATIANASDFEGRFGHYRSLSDTGMRMATFDPGSINLANHGPDGLPGPMSFVYQTTYADIAALVDLLADARLGPSIAVYEPGFLRTTLAYERAGRLPAGAFVKLYLAGPYNFLDGQRSNVTFGLPPTEKALDAYCEMMEGSSLPWAVAVIGGSVEDSGMARLAIERGGHVRVGLEDYRGEDTPSNADLVARVVAVAKACGRSIATSGEAAAILGLPR